MGFKGFRSDIERAAKGKPSERLESFLAMCKSKRVVPWMALDVASALYVRLIKTPLIIKHMFPDKLGTEVRVARLYDLLHACGIRKIVAYDDCDMCVSQPLPGPFTLTPRQRVKISRLKDKEAKERKDARSALGLLKGSDVARWEDKHLTTFHCLRHITRNALIEKADAVVYTDDNADDVMIRDAIEKPGCIIVSSDTDFLVVPDACVLSPNDLFRVANPGMFRELQKKLLQSPILSREYIERIFKLTGKPGALERLLVKYDVDETPFKNVANQTLHIQELSFLNQPLQHPLTPELIDFTEPMLFFPYQLSANSQTAVYAVFGKAFRVQREIAMRKASLWINPNNHRDGRITGGEINERRLTLLPIMSCSPFLGFVRITTNGNLFCGFEVLNTYAQHSRGRASISFPADKIGWVARQLSLTKYDIWILCEVLSVHGIPKHIVYSMILSAATTVETLCGMQGDVDNMTPITVGPVVLVMYLSLMFISICSKTLNFPSDHFYLSAVRYLALLMVKFVGHPVFVGEQKRLFDDIVEFTGDRAKATSFVTEALDGMELTFEVSIIIRKMLLPFYNIVPVTTSPARRKPSGCIASPPPLLLDGNMWLACVGRGPDSGPNPLNIMQNLVNSKNNKFSTAELCTNTVEKFSIYRLIGWCRWFGSGSAGETLFRNTFLQLLSFVLLARTTKSTFDVECNSCFNKIPSLSSHPLTLRISSLLTQSVNEYLEDYNASLSLEWRQIVLTRVELLSKVRDLLFVVRRIVFNVFDLSDTLGIPWTPKNNKQLLPIKVELPYISTTYEEDSDVIYLVQRLTTHYRFFLNRHYTHNAHAVPFVFELDSIIKAIFCEVKELEASVHSPPKRLFVVETDDPRNESEAALLGQMMSLGGSNITVVGDKQPHSKSANDNPDPATPKYIVVCQGDKGNNLKDVCDTLAADEKGSVQLIYVTRETMRRSDIDSVTSTVGTPLYIKYSQLKECGRQFSMSLTGKGGHIMPLNSFLAINNINYSGPQPVSEPVRNTSLSMLVSHLMFRVEQFKRLRYEEGDEDGAQELAEDICGEMITTLVHTTRSPLRLGVLSREAVDPVLFTDHLAQTIQRYCVDETKSAEAIEVEGNRLKIDIHQIAVLGSPVVESGTFLTCTVVNEATAAFGLADNLDLMIVMPKCLLPVSSAPCDILYFDVPIRVK